MLPVRTGLNGRSHLYDGVQLDATPQIPQLLRAGVTRFLVDGTLMNIDMLSRSVARTNRALEAARSGARPTSVFLVQALAACSKALNRSTSNRMSKGAGLHTPLPCFCGCLYLTYMHRSVWTTYRYLSICSDCPLSRCSKHDDVLLVRPSAQGSTRVAAHANSAFPRTTPPRGTQRPNHGADGSSSPSRPKRNR